jgi:membrane protein implicated in regulation of membrane protease activity
MLESISLNGYAFWLLLGLLLLISELFTPVLVAMFFGIGALVVGLLTLAGLIDSLGVQLLLFALISVGSLFALRKHFKRWLQGDETSASNTNPDNVELVGKRVRVLTDFQQGMGDVQLNGAKWDAESTDALKAGDSAWVLGHSGILLRVAATPPKA